MPLAPEPPGTLVTEVTVDEVGEPPGLPVLDPGKLAVTRHAAAPRRGRRMQVESRDGAGLYVRAQRPRGPLRDLALDATLRAAVQRHNLLPDAERSPVAKERWIASEDLREKVRVRRAGAAIAFVVDASGSMRAGRRMVETKGAILSLLMSAYTARDRVALVAFRGQSAQVLLPFTSSIEVARHQLDRLPAGGKTPLAAGLAAGLQLIEAERRRRAQAQPLMVVLSDGKPNVAADGHPVRAAEAVAWRIRQARVPLLFLDTDTTWHEPGMGQTLTRITAGRYLAVADVAADRIHSAVADIRERLG